MKRAIGIDINKKHVSLVQLCKKGGRLFLEKTYTEKCSTKEKIQTAIKDAIENERVDLDLRGQVGPSVHFSERNYYQAVPYTQLFGLDFEPNLSVLDILFCAGPEAKKLLLSSVKN